MAIALTIAYTATPLAAGVQLAIYASGQLSPGKMRVNAKSLKLLQVTAAAAASPANILANYNSQHGTLVSGRKIFYRLVPINASGVAGAAVDGSIIIT